MQSVQSPSQPFRAIFIHDNEKYHFANTFQTQQLQDLRAPLLPQTTSASLLNSLLGSSGGTKAQGQSRTGASNATDLTSLVRRKDKDADKSKDVPGKHASGGDSSQPMAGTNVKEEANGTKEQAGKDDGVEKKRGKRGLLLDGEDAGGSGAGVSGDEGMMSASEGVAEGVKRVRVDWTVPGKELEHGRWSYAVKLRTPMAIWWH